MTVHTCVHVWVGVGHTPVCLCVPYPVVCLVYSASATLLAVAAAALREGAKHDVLRRSLNVVCYSLTNNALVSLITSCRMQVM